MEKVNPQDVIARNQGENHSPNGSRTRTGNDLPPGYRRAINALVETFSLTWGYYLRGKSEDEVALAKRLWAHDLIRYADDPAAIMAGVELARTNSRDVPSPMELRDFIRRAQGKPSAPAHRIAPRQLGFDRPPSAETIEAHRREMRDRGLMP